MAIMILAEEGKISYDDSVHTYLPEFTFDNITIRHLLNHTSGLPNYMYYVEHKLPKDSIPYNDVMLKVMFENNPKLNFNPGRKFSYCNTGYAILPLIVEKVTGKTFIDFVETKIFKKLGMNSSFVYSRLFENKHKGRTMGYFRWRGRYAVNLDTKNDGIVGDKGIYSTISDLRKWDDALYNNTLVSDSTISQAFTRVRLSNGRDWHYGFGFRIKEVKDRKVVYHFGRWNSFKTYLGRYIEDHSTIILLNNTNRNISWLVKKIEHILFKDSTKVTIEQDSTILQ
ncbi:MAG: serine hydrolase domain-containing protein, partial [Rhodothermaceae bacterium]